LFYTTANQDERLVTPGQWNRLEGTVIGSDVTVSLNGHPIEHQHPLKNLASKRQLTLMASGPTDFANLYIRKID
jgi:hypothetical protein